ncbi:MAG: endolytic transglycosylase MltG, partial [Balneolaceae bacterium]
MKTQEPVVLYIQEQSSLEEVVDLLEDLDVELDREEIRWISGLLGWRNFSIGRYELDGEYSYEGLLSRLSLGLQDHASVTIPSGATVGRLAATLSRQMKADSLDFAVLFSHESELLAEFDMSSEELFSRMIPDTYNFYWTTAPGNVIKRIYNEFVRRFEERYAEEIEESSLDLNQLVILASIIEWEA